jgi:hypothetical protein
VSDKKPSSSGKIVMTSRRTILGGIAMSAAGVIPLSPSYPSSSHIIQLTPSGDPSGATDTAQLNDALTKYPIVQMLPGAPAGGPHPVRPWYVNAPIIVPSNTRLTGNWFWQAVDSDDYSAGPLNTGGVLIVAVGRFSGQGVIELANDGTQQQGAQVLEGFTLECDALPPGSGTHGIRIEGAVGAGFIQGVTVHRPDGDCLHMATSKQTGFIPDDWQISFCKFSASRSGSGVYLNELADSWFVACEASENRLDNWYCSYGTNTRFLSCKGENSLAGNGWHFGGLGTGEVLELTGCTSQFNNANGFLFDNSSGGGELGTYTLTGCRSWRDGRDRGGKNAGFSSTECRSRIIGTGCVTSPDSTGSAYGAMQTAKSYGMCFTGAYLAGTEDPTHDDGSNDHALVHQSPVPF